MGGESKERRRRVHELRKSCIQKAIKAGIERFMGAAQNLISTYPTIWEAWLRGNHPEWLNTDDAYGTPEFFKALSSYVRSHAGTYPIMRALLPGEKQEQLKDLEERMMENLGKEDGIIDTVSYISWHWTIGFHMQDSFWDRWHNPRADTLDFLIDYKENGTLPQGPVATAEEWRSNARLGYTVFGCCVWCRDFKVWFFYLSRNMEHSSLATIAMVEDVLGRIRMPDTIRTIHSWSDGGSHFRSKLYLGWMGCRITEKYKKNAMVSYGVLNHFKSPVDGKFGNMNNLVETAAAQEQLIEVDDMVKALARCNENGENNFIYWEPPAKSEVWREKLVTSCLPCGVHSSYHWEFFINDRRRVSLEGRPDKAGRPFTGVTAKACRLADVRGEAVFTLKLKHPVPDAAPEAADEEDHLDEDEVAEEIQLQITTKAFWGWRTSWRQKTPEQVALSQWRAALKRRYLAMKAVHGIIPRRGRRKSTEVKLQKARTFTKARKAALHSHSPCTPHLIQHV